MSGLFQTNSQNIFQFSNVPAKLCSNSFHLLIKQVYAFSVTFIMIPPFLYLDSISY